MTRHKPASPRDPTIGLSGEAPRGPTIGLSGEAPRGPTVGLSGEAPRGPTIGLSGEAPRGPTVGLSGEAPREASTPAAWGTPEPGGPALGQERVRGKYAIERRLGGGGMAEVFLARTLGAEGFSRPVALKRVLPGFSDNSEFARMFVSEAQLTSRLQHPNIVSVLDFDRDEQGRLFLVMELVDGVDLDALVDTGPLPVSLVIYLAVEILMGLRYAHDLPLRADDRVRGIVHRDISPHNVLVSWEGAVKVSDFGIAKSRAASQATASLLIKGKPAYMSPEQVNGQPLDGRSDLFAVGVMLWQVLCQQPLFAGTTTEETIGRLLFAPIASPHLVRPDMPADVSRCVQRLLTRELEQRTPDAAAAIAELIACADYPRNGRELLIQTLAERFAGRAAIPGHRVTTASPTDRTRVAEITPGRRPSAFAGPVTLTQSRSATTRTMPPSPARGRRAGWAIAACAVAALGGGAFWLSGRAPDPARPPAHPAGESKRASTDAPSESPPAHVAAPEPRAGSGAGSASEPAPPPPLTDAAAKSGGTTRDSLPPPRSNRSRSDSRAKGSGGERIQEIRLGE